VLLKDRNFGKFYLVVRSQIVRRQTHETLVKTARPFSSGGMRILSSGGLRGHSMLLGGWLLLDGRFLLDGWFPRLRLHADFPRCLPSFCGYQRCLMRCPTSFGRFRPTPRPPARLVKRHITTGREKLSMLYGTVHKMFRMHNKGGQNPN
jgi:hypothetical protein